MKSSGKYFIFVLSLLAVIGPAMAVAQVKPNIVLVFLDNFGLGKHRVYGVGHEVTIPIASKAKLYGFINAHYFWEFGARSALEGNTFVLTAMFPIPKHPPNIFTVRQTQTGG